MYLPSCVVVVLLIIATVSLKTRILILLFQKTVHPVVTCDSRVIFSDLIPGVIDLLVHQSRWAHLVSGGDPTFTVMNFLLFVMMLELPIFSATPPSGCEAHCVALWRVKTPSVTLEFI